MNRAAGNRAAGSRAAESQTARGQAPDRAPANTPQPGTRQATEPDPAHPECLFCRIASGSLPVTRIFEDEQVLAFPDINPQAPVHVLVIPKRHLASHAHATPQDAAMLGHLLGAAGEVARSKGLQNGYRMVVNTGPDGGQTVDHLHVHVLGGRHMAWPPG